MKRGNRRHVPEIFQVTGEVLLSCEDTGLAKLLLSSEFMPREESQFHDIVTDDDIL